MTQEEFVEKWIGTNFIHIELAKDLMRDDLKLLNNNNLNSLKHDNETRQNQNLFQSSQNSTELIMEHD